MQAMAKPAGRTSLAALLHVGPSEVLRVGFQHVVDLVEDVVGLGGQLLPPLLTGSTGGIGSVVVAVPATLSRGLFLGHIRFSDLWIAAADFTHGDRQRTRSTPDGHRDCYCLVSASTSSVASSAASNNAPTWALVPRVGSMVGILTSESRPMSKITESQDAAANRSAYLATHRPRK